MFFWNFIANSKKTLGFLLFLDQIPKNPWFFWNSTKFQKKHRVFQNSKIPKIFGEVHKSFGILEFWKTRCFFWNFGRKPLKTLCFFESHSKFQKNLRFFDVFGSNSKKNSRFFGILQNSKKTSSFPKFQKFQEAAYLPKYFWNFGILENSSFFLEFWFYSVSLIIFLEFWTTPLFAIYPFLLY